MLGQIGSIEILIIIIVILIVLGPKQIPHIMRQAGKVYRELNSIKKSLMEQIDDLDKDERTPENIVIPENNDLGPYENE